MFGTGEIIVILGVILILFGGKKLPEFARHLGQGIREFKKACNGIEDDEDVNVKTKSAPIKQPETIVVEVKRDEDHDRS